MTFTTSAPAAALAKAFAMAARVSPRSSSAPILQNLLLHAHEGKLRVTGANKDATITVDVDAEASGAITAPADKLTAIASRLDGAKPLKLKLEGSQLIATQGRSRFTLPTLPADEFAERGEPHMTASFDVRGDALGAALKATEGATDDNAVARANLSGVFLDANGGAPVLVSANSAQISVSPLATVAPEDMPGVIIPPATFSIIHAMAGMAETVRIETGPNAIALVAAGVRYESKVIDGTFPNWRRILERDAKRAARVGVAGDEMRLAMERIKAIGESVLHINFMDGVAIEARNKDKAASGAEEAIDATIEGEPAAIILNSFDLAWALASLPGAATYVFGLKSSLDSVLVSDPARPEDVRLVMPLRG